MEIVDAKLSNIDLLESQFICDILFFDIFLLAIIRDVVQKRFEVYHKLEEAARLALEQEAAAKAAEERKRAEEMVTKAAEEAKAEETLKSEQEVDGRETADKPEDDSVAGEEGGSEHAPTADTPAESGQNEPDAEPEQE